MILVWTIWLIAIVLSFAAFETYAIYTKRMTLSAWTWMVSKAFPPFPFLVGFLVGFLACHFWWGGVVSFAAIPSAFAQDLALTPGVARTDLTLAEICSRKWGKDRRHVTPAMRREALARYGKPACRPDKHGRRFELDHLISRELGGADDVNNLWPQCYAGKPWNAVLKDRLENKLHTLVCSGQMSLEDAQHQIVADWRALYRHVFGDGEKL